MTVAAFVVSIIAAIVAGLSALYARKQAASAEEVRKIEAARRHDELCPKLLAEYVPSTVTRDGPRPAVKLTNRGPLDLDRIDIQAVPAHKSKEAAIDGLYDHRTGETAVMQETGPVRLGESWTFAVIAARGGPKTTRGGAATFRCTCHAAGHQPWVVIVSVLFPAAPEIF
ncbi:hypothetical protein [Dactylosporangium sp. NPDC051484]|uniref:hypothetical protein n=1 Tax=Dactylosporangium sp. NPDC051484 TaxID=3154942 RepID=UPI00344F6520